METGKPGPEDTTPEAQERPTTDGDGQQDTTTPSEPERAGESPRTGGSTTDGETAARTDEEPPRGAETPRNDPDRETPVTDGETTPAAADHPTTGDTTPGKLDTGRTAGRTERPPEDAPQAPKRHGKSASRTNYHRKRKAPPRATHEPKTRVIHGIAHGREQTFAGKSLFRDTG